MKADRLETGPLATAKTQHGVKRGRRYVLCMLQKQRRAAYRLWLALKFASLTATRSIALGTRGQGTNSSRCSVYLLLAINRPVYLVKSPLIRGSREESRIASEDFACRDTHLKVDDLRGVR